MIAAEGILTARGGVSSHAALVARQMGKVCVCGAAALDVDYYARTVKVEPSPFAPDDFGASSAARKTQHAAKIAVRMR